MSGREQYRRQWVSVLSVMESSDEAILGASCGAVIHHRYPQAAEGPRLTLKIDREINSMLIIPSLAGRLLLLLYPAAHTQPTLGTDGRMLSGGAQQIRTDAPLQVVTRSQKFCICGQANKT